MKGSLQAWDTSRSPFASVIGTNHAPSSAELDQLKDLLVEPQHELESLQSEISCLQMLLDALQGEKNQVETYIEAHRTLMSPIRRIPSETLGEIFMYCLPSDTQPFSVRDMKQAPLLITTICRHWRRVSIDTPMLWSSLHIHLPYRLSEEVAFRRITGVNLWLERSATLPISVSLHGCSRYRDDSPDEPTYDVADTNWQLRSSKTMMSFMKSLQRFNHRILCLHLCLSPEDFRMFHSFLQPSTSFPALVSLKLDKYNYGYPEPGVPDLFLGLAKGSRMPALRTLDFTRGYVWPDTENLTREWPTNMSISQYMPLSFLCSIVMQNPLLQSLRIGLDLTSEDNIVLPTATLTNLTSLSLDLQSNFLDQDRLTRMYNRMSAVFSLMDSPSLKSLSIRFSAIQSPASQSPFHGMSLNDLETLSLHFPLTPEALTDCLVSVPNITSLHFVDLGNWNEYHDHCISSILQDTHLSRLGLAPDNHSSLCPKLRHIRIIDHTSLSHSPDHCESSWSSIVLTDFLEARVRSKALDSFDLFSYRPLRSFLEPQLDRLVQLKEEWGLRLHLHQRFIPTPFVDDSPTMGLQTAYPMQHYVLGDTDTII